MKVSLTHSKVLETSSIKQGSEPERVMHQFMRQREQHPWEHEKSIVIYGKYQRKVKNIALLDCWSEVSI